MQWRVDLDGARRTPWAVVYLAAGVAMVANLAGDAYSRSVSLCELYPQFSFAETLQEEVLLHHTRLPVIRAPVSTLLLLAVYVAGYVALHLRLLEKTWLLLHVVLSGRWLADLLFVHLPHYVPFIFSEPGVPELLSDGEDDDLGLDDVDDSPPVDAQETQRALEKLRQVRLEHANCTIERPDDWLVFDPEQQALVLQKTRLARVSPSANGTANGVRDNKDKGDELNPAAALGDACDRPPSASAPLKSKKRVTVARGDPGALVPNGHGSDRDQL